MSGAPSPPPECTVTSPSDDRIYPHRYPDHRGIRDSRLEYSLKASFPDCRLIIFPTQKKNTILSFHLTHLWLVPLTEYRSSLMEYHYFYMHTYCLCGPLMIIWEMSFMNEKESLDIIKLSSCLVSSLGPWLTRLDSISSLGITNEPSQVFSSLGITINKPARASSRAKQAGAQQQATMKPWPSNSLIGHKADHDPKSRCVKTLERQNKTQIYNLAHSYSLVPPAAACVCHHPLLLSFHYSCHPRALLLPLLFPSGIICSSTAFCGHFLPLHIASFSWCGATDSALIYSYFWVLQLVSCEDPSWSFIYPGVGFWNWIERFRSIEASNSCFNSYMDG